MTKPFEVIVMNIEELDKTLLNYFGAKITRIEEPISIESYRQVEGFELLGRYMAFLNKNSKRYSQEKNLTRLETQANRNLRDFDYHRAIIAFKKHELLGVTICEWKKFDGLPFWRYCAELTETNKNHRKIGIGKATIKTLDEADFLNSKILQEGIYLEDGEKYVKPVIRRELRAENYAFIPNDYPCPNPPFREGKYFSA